MKSLGIAAALLVAAGCAATAPAPAVPADGTATSAEFPARVAGDEQLPEVRRFNRAIDREHGGSVDASVQICVAPNGDVTSAELVESSGLAEYDQALVERVERTWKYEPYEAPAGTRVCQTMKVSYSAAG